jgi:choline dehydrogenase
MTATTPEPEYDYLVVGAGAGGGPLAANLARKGHRVLLLEAGGDPGDLLTYQVPAFHGFATEDPAITWDYHVRHYSDENLAKQDSKFDPTAKGVWYPRASALGGSAAHNALITVYPHNSAWDDLAELTRDPTWNGDAMRQYFERLERCEYISRPEPGDPGTARHGFDGWLSTSTAPPSLGDQGQQFVQEIATAALAALLTRVRNPTALASLLLARLDLDAKSALKILKLLVDPGAPPDLGKVAEELLKAQPGFLPRLFDPNDWEFVKNGMEGLCVVPLAVTARAEEGRLPGGRSSPREFIQATQKKLNEASQPQGKLEVWTDALVTKVLFQPDDPNNTAVGVEYVRGQRRHSADRRPAPPPPAPPKEKASVPTDAAPAPDKPEGGDPTDATPKPVRAREVILCAGTLNTPQLLMLSGVGPEEHLKAIFHDDPAFRVRVNLPGVGKNLQDCYEVGVISELKAPLNLTGATFVPPPSNKADDAALANDPALKDWKLPGKGLYATNGAVLGIVLKSRRDYPEPDLFILGLPGDYPGYFQRYDQLPQKGKGHFTWAILKAHTHNRAGTVTLRSKGPCDAPEINFRYFGDGKADDEDAGDDLEPLVAGVKFVRTMTAAVPSVARTVLPGVKDSELTPSVSDEDVRGFIRKEAWGRQACGTCRMGPKTRDEMVPHGDPEAVVDSDFRVYGTRNLRVVDASVFPHAPGFFLATAVYMLSEKASDVIDQGAAGAVRPGPPAGKKG